MAPAGDLPHYSFPVTKTEELDDGTLKLWGRATDGSLDSDLQIVDPVWSEKALAEWYASGLTSGYSIRRSATRRARASRSGAMTSA